jgi:hypothetical protein
MRKGPYLICASMLAWSCIAGGAAHAAGRPLSATLTGAAEAPGPGDPDGAGQARVTLNHGLGEVCFELHVSNIAPATAAHIHEAPPGAPGPVVIPLSPPPSGGFSQACLTADRALIKRIIQNPGAFYINVHNAEFPPGAIRGQLTK